MKIPKRMSSGRYIDLSSLTEDDLFLEDIIPAINYIYRFTGHHDRNPPLTVAQHSMLCLRLAEKAGESPDVKLATLTHDFAEAYVGDVATPLKKMLGKHWIRIAKPIEEMVNNKFSPSGNDPEVHERVKIYDTMSLDIERRCMWNQRGKDNWPTPNKNVGTLEDKYKLFKDVKDYGKNPPLYNLWKDLWEECYG